MSKVALSGNALGSGTLTIAAPNTSTDRIINLPDSNGTILTTATPGVPVNGPAFSAYLNTATQALSNGAYTKIAINTEEFDTNNNFDSTTNYRFTPTVAGYYQINGCVNINNTSSTRNLCSVFKNGSEYKRGVDLGGIIPSTVGVVVSSLVYLNGSTDYVELYAYCAAASTVASGGNTYATYFNGALVRSAT